MRNYFITKAAVIVASILGGFTFSHAGLITSDSTYNSITLQWTAPGDDGNVGTASQYDLRYSTSNIDNSNWASATQVSGEPAPLPAGSQQTFTVTGLQPGTRYYFAIKTGDEVPNWSSLSNIATRTTASDVIPPANIMDLATSNPTGNSIRLSWTAPGDDSSSGIASQYDIRYSTSPITNANWASATQVSGEPAPLPAGTQQTFTVTGLQNQQTYYFAIKTADEVPNWSGLSNVPSGTTLDTIPPGAITDLSAILPERAMLQSATQLLLMSREAVILEDKTGSLS
jgi:hypothetical protein